MLALTWTAARGEKDVPGMPAVAEGHELGGRDDGLVLEGPALRVVAVRAHLREAKRIMYEWVCVYRIVVVRGECRGGDSGVLRDECPVVQRDIR